MSSSHKTFRFILSRPLSSLTACLSILIILYEAFQLLKGDLYFEVLNYIDGTTLIMLGILILWGVFTMRENTDFQAVSFTLVNALSFIFAYEAIFKWSFYLAPFRQHMPPAEFRDFVIETGIALTVLAGFADGHFTLKKWTFVWIGLFITLWAVWLLVGFPQLTGQFMFTPVIKINFTGAMTYIINRATKLILFFGYFTFFPVSKNNIPT